MATRWYSIEQVKSKVNRWMTRGQNVLLVMGQNGYEKIYTVAEEAVEDIGKHILEFYLYNPNPPKDGEFQYCLHIKFYESSDFWRIGKTNYYSKRQRKFLKEIQDNWDAIKSGGYKRIPHKTRKRKTVNLGDFFKDNNITEELFQQGLIELSLRRRISEKLYNILLEKQYTNFFSLSHNDVTNLHGHIITSDYCCGKHVVRHNAEGKCTTTIWYVDYEITQLYDCAWEDLCKVKFDDIKLDEDGEVICYLNKISDNDRYLKVNVMPLISEDF